MAALPSEIFSDIELLIESRYVCNEFRQNGLLCDLTIRTIDEKEFKVHKLILASSCSYFRDLLEKDKIWKETDLPVITLEKDISSECFAAVLDYLYTGKIEINSENASLLHEGAVYFNLKNLKTVVTKYPIKRIEMNTVLNFWRYGVKYFNCEIEEKCLEFINENCVEFFEKYLEDLNSSEMNKITSNKNLKLPQESLYSFITNWIKQDLPNRKYHLQSLLNNINIELIDKVEENNELENVLIGITSNLLYTIFLNDEQRIFSPLLKFKKKQFDISTIFHQKYLLLLYIDDSLKCECFDSTTNVLKEIPVLPSVFRKSCGVATLNNRIFVAGGLVRRECVKSTEILDLDAGIWIQGPDLLEKRHSFSLIAAENTLYAIGGENQLNNGHSTIEKFDLTENKWEALPVSYPAIGFNRAVYFNQNIYCFTEEGGRIFNIITNDFDGVISKQPVDWLFNTFNVAHNPSDSFCYVFGKHGYPDRYIGFKYTFENSAWEDLKIEFPSAIEGNLNITLLNMPVGFQKCGLVSWMNDNTRK